MPLDAGAVRRGCRGAKVESAGQLCRAELERFRGAVASGAPLTIGCTQEAPLFAKLAQESKKETNVTFVNVRETAGWSSQANAAGPKMAALLAAGAETTPEVSFVTLTSEGVIGSDGRADQAIETAHVLKDHLDVTVMITKPVALAPGRVNEFPVVKGTIRSAKGHLGAFEIVVDDFAVAAPSSRGALAFGPGREGAVSRCDIMLDISGSASVFTANDLRDGYLRADPGDPTAVLRAAIKARDLVGTFDKPRYIAFSEDLCVHSRSRIVGCRRCLDLCPAGAIEPAGDHVAIDANICAGCGQCAAVCPTGAAAYSLPPADVLMRKLRTLLTVYREAGGLHPVLLLHDDRARRRAHRCRSLATAMACPRMCCRSLSTRSLWSGSETIAAALAYGASALRVLLRAKPRHDIAGLTKTIALAEPILTALGFSSSATIETDDPDVLGAALAAIEAHTSSPRPASFLPVGAKREVMQLALHELHAAALTPIDVVALPEGAPFGLVEIDIAGCIALSWRASPPARRVRSAMIRSAHCCASPKMPACSAGCVWATCPEKVITLTPRLDFRATTAAARVLKQEEPFHCIRCNKPFGVKSTIERVIGKLAGQHWMYEQGSKRLDALRMCEDCRVAVVTEDGFDPHTPPRPNVRTTDDYLRERVERERAEKGES